MSSRRGLENLILPPYSIAYLTARYEFLSYKIRAIASKFMDDDGKPFRNDELFQSPSCRSAPQAAPKFRCDCPESLDILFDTDGGFCYNLRTFSPAFLSAFFHGSHVKRQAIGRGSVLICQIMHLRKSACARSKSAVRTTVALNRL